MDSRNRLARAGAACYVLWGLLHLVGAGFQLHTLRASGGAGLTALVASARPAGPGAFAPIPEGAEAFMGMGVLNLLWIGALVTVIGATLNWRNSRLGYWLNLGVAGGTDLALLVALLWPGVMAWSDGGVGLGLFLLAATFSTLGRVGGGSAPIVPQPV